jgi:membrane protease YdiL (CAAX protease family)
VSATPSARPGITSWPWLVELGIVLWVSLGASAVRALLNLLNRLTLDVPLSEQTATIVGSVTPDRPALDLAYQVAGIVLALGPVGLVWYLLRRSGEGAAGIGLDRSQPRRDLGRGLFLALLVGSVGLAFYLIAYQVGISVAVTAVNAAQFWWTTPLLLAEAAQNAVVEEVIILGYFLHRTQQAGLSAPASIAGAAVIRGAYHLYQGFGGFVGNVVMGLFFGWLYTRWRRTGPFIAAHFLIDAVAFAGYYWLRDTLTWLP